MAIMDICQEETTRDIFLRQMEALFSAEILLDPTLTPKQSLKLSQLLSHPKKTDQDEQLDDAHAMLHVLRGLDQWNLRAGWVEVKLAMQSMVTQQQESPLNKVRFFLLVEYIWRPFCGMYSFFLNFLLNLLVFLLFIL